MAIFTGIGSAIFGAGTFLAGLTAATLQIAAGIGISLIAKSLAGEPEKAKFGVQGRLQGGDDIPRSILFGYNCTAGSLVYGNTWGTASGVPNAYLTQVIALADYPIRELIGVEVNGASVTLGGTPHPQFGFPVTQFNRNGTDHLWIKFYDGTQTTVDPFLVGSVSSTARPYSSNRIGIGIPYVITTAMAHERNDGEEEALFNGFPTFKFVTNGARLYDISRDSTAPGGSGSQRYNNPATWGGDGDFNPAVQIYNLLRGIQFGNQWLYGLQKTTEANLPAAEWVRVINKCRVPIQGESGLEPTYRTGGEIQVGAQIKFSIESILTGCQGRISEVGGVYKMNVGEADAPVIAFTDADIISTKEQTFTPFFTLEDTINGIQATYPNPSESWNTKTAPPLYRPDLEALSDNRRLMADVTLDMVPYPAQVQRLMKSALAEAQRARRHTVTMGPEFWVLEPGDIISWTSDRNGYIDKLFRVDGMSDQPDLDILLDITEVDPSDYDWNQSVDFRPVVNTPIQLVGAPPLPMIGWQVYAVAIRDEQNRERKPAIEIWFQSGLQDIRAVKFQVRRFGQTEIFITGEVPYGSPWRTVIQGDFPADSEFEVRGIFVRESGGLSEWSDWLYVKTLNIKLIPGLDFDPYSGTVGFEQLEGDIQGYLDFIGDNLRAIVENAQELAVRVAEQDLAQTIRFSKQNASYSQAIYLATGPNSGLALRIEELEVRVDNDIANAISLLQTEITEQGQAFATAITQVTTLVGNNSSGGYLRITSEATEAGANATIGLSTSATTGGPASQASLFLSSIAGGLSRVTIVANQFVVSSPAGPQNPLVYDGTALRLNVANIGTITAGVLRSADGKFIIDLNNKRISIST